MRFANLIPAALVLTLSSTALAQTEWAEFVDRADHFLVNFPGLPEVKDLQYRTASGSTVPAHVYSAQDRRGQYILTVADYRNASEADAASAIEDAADAFRTKGNVTFDLAETLDGHDTRRLSVETSDGYRWLAEILISNAKRFYMLEAATALSAPPPAQFQASLQVLDDNGVRIRYSNGQAAGALDPRPGN